MPNAATTAERIAQLTAKVQLRGTRLGPTVPEDMLAAFEARCGCSLPEVYRAFLRQVGNGGLGPPTYGLLRLGDTPDDIPEEELRPWNDLQRVRRPFPFTRPWVWEDGDPSDEGTREQIVDGSIHLGTDGCAQYWLLIVSGPERGNVWMLADVGIAPTVPKRDFLQWFEDWLDGVRDWWA